MDVQIPPSHVVPGPHVPHSPLQPSLPQLACSQLGVQHVSPQLFTAISRHSAGHPLVQHAGFSAHTHAETAWSLHPPPGSHVPLVWLETQHSPVHCPQSPGHVAQLSAIDDGNGAPS